MEEKKEITISLVVEEQLIEKLKKIAESENRIVKDEVALALEERVAKYEKKQSEFPI